MSNDYTLTDEEAATIARFKKLATEPPFNLDPKYKSAAEQLEKEIVADAIERAR